MHPVCTPKALCFGQHVDHASRMGTARHDGEVDLGHERQCLDQRHDSARLVHASRVDSERNVVSQACLSPNGVSDRWIEGPGDRRVEHDLRRFIERMLVS